MATGDRANKIKEEEYMEGFYRIVQSTADRIWLVIDGSIQLDREFPSLHKARKWCKENPANPEYEGSTS